MLTNLGGVCIALSAVSTASTPGRTVHAGGSAIPRKLRTTSAPANNSASFDGSVTDPSTSVTALSSSAGLGGKRLCMTFSAFSLLRTSSRTL